MSAFGHHTTTDEVLEGVDLSGKTVFITGANSGLGQESARAMAASTSRQAALSSMIRTDRSAKTG